LAYLEDKFHVAALCDVSPKVLQAVGKRWGVTKLYTDYHQLLAQGDVDAVLVANPNAYHTEVALAAISAGKNVLVEKPMCITLREADEIIAAQSHAKATVQVGYMRRYAPAFIEVCRQLPEIGEIRLARVHDVIGQNPLVIKNVARVARGDDVPPDIIEAGKKLGKSLMVEALGDAYPNLRTAYGLLLGLASHDTSAMRELLGTPKRVLYAAQRMGGVYISSAFDYGNYVCHFEMGVDMIPRVDEYMQVYGSNRILRVEYDTPYVRNLPVRSFSTEANGRGGVTQTAVHPVWGDPFVAEWEAFYDNVMQKRTPKTSPADFREDLVIFKEMIQQMSR